MNYQKASRISKEVGETNDCAVKAVAIVCDKPYRMVQDKLSSLGRRSRQGTQTVAIEKAIKGYGFKITRVEGESPYRFGGTPTTLTNRLPSKGMYFAYTRSHIIAVKNGKIEDWTEGRRHRILQVYKVERTERKPRHNKAAA